MFPSMFGNDPHFTDPFEQMDRMMRSSFMFEDPFAMHRSQRMLQLENGVPSAQRHLPLQSMMPFGGMMGGMSSMNQMMMNMQQSMMGMHGMPSIGAGSHSFQSSTMVMTNDGSGPRVIQSSSSTRMGPDGVRETRRSHKDSGTGEMRMAIGHHINERGHVIEKSKNQRTGDQEETQEYINIEEDDAESFNSEWTQRMSSSSRHHRGLSHHQLAGRHDPYHRNHPRSRRRPHTAAITYTPADNGSPTQSSHRSKD